jgi:hypothetical protein
MITKGFAPVSGIKVFAIMVGVTGGMRGMRLGMLLLEVLRVGQLGWDAAGK